jgi:hypothetical protein
MNTTQLEETMAKRAMMIGLIGAAVLAMTGAALAAEKTPIGRWNLTVDNHPSWLAIERQGDKYVGRFLGGAGSVGGIGEVKIDGMKVEFNAHDRKWTGTVENDALEGTWEKGQEKGKWSGKRAIPKIDVTGKWAIKPMGLPVERPAIVELTEQDGKLAGTYEEGGKKTEITNARANAGMVMFTVSLPAGKSSFMAAAKGDLLDGIVEGEASKLRRNFKAYRQRQWGDTVELFNGKDLDNWEQFGDLKNKNWKVVDGVMATTGGANIVSKDKFRNFRLHVEFMVPKGGNSGVYLRGRHEIQVSDSVASNPPTWHDCGALYSRIAPAVNACKKADEWQSYDITMVENYLTVIFNGQVIIDNEEVEGITGGMLDCNESEPGPIYLQGDHGKISYRKITIWPSK